MEYEALFLPGLLCDEELFAKLNWPKNWRVRVAELPPLESMEELAAAVLAAAPAKFILGGLSMGGLLLWEIYRQASKRVQALLLFDTNFAAEKAEVSAARNRLVALSEEGKFERITPDYIMPKLLSKKALADSHLVQIATQMAERVGSESFKAHARALETRKEARDLLTTVWQPTLIICGRDDQLCPVQRHLEMADLIPESTLYILKDCGHLSTLEQPEKISEFLQNWWLFAVHRLKECNK